MKDNRGLSNLLTTKNINYPEQASMLKKLCSRYSYEDVCYASSYYISKGLNLYSLGFLIYDNYKYMNKALKIKKVEDSIKNNVGDSSERNKRKHQDNLQTKYRTESYFDLFEE